MPVRVLISSGLFERAAAVETILVPTGFEAAIATNPADCLEVCRSGWPDIVLLDGVGPLSDARERCRDIRAGAETAHMAVLILTDRHDPKQNLFALEAGADECLGYPFDRQVLLARLRSLAQWKSLADEWRSLASAEEREDSHGTLGGRARGLVFDPDGRSCERLTEILSREYEILSTQDEIQALARLALGPYDFVLVGLEWQDVRASRLCQRIRLLERGRHPRLLLVTGEGGWRSQDLEEHGIDDVIFRPVDRNEVLARVRLAGRKQELATMLRTWKPLRRGSSRTIVLSKRFVAPPDRFAA